MLTCHLWGVPEHLGCLPDAFGLKGNLTPEILPELVDAFLAGKADRPEHLVEPPPNEVIPLGLGAGQNILAIRVDREQQLPVSFTLVRQLAVCVCLAQANIKTVFKQPRLFSLAGLTVAEAIGCCQNEGPV